jgi:hypothetical protein
MLPTRQLTLRNHKEKRHGEPCHFRKAYLVLLRVEIARFTRTQSARLCCSDPHLTVERCYLLRCPVQSGRSSSASFRRLHQRRSGELHAGIITCGHALVPL